MSSVFFKSNVVRAFISTKLYINSIHRFQSSLKIICPPFHPIGYVSSSSFKSRAPVISNTLTRMLTTCFNGGRRSITDPSIRNVKAPAIPIDMQVRKMGHLRKLKTKKGAAKRFIVTGKGKLKRGHAYKGHLTSGKSKTRLRRLNTKVLLTGVWAKKMKMLIMNGK